MGNQYSKVITSIPISRKLIWGSVGVLFVVGSSTAAFVLYKKSLEDEKSDILEEEKKSPWEERATGMLLGIAVGDAKGIPYANHSYEQVQKSLKEQGLTLESIIDSKLYFASVAVDDPKQKVYTKCAKLNTKPGQWIDKTQLSIALATALTNSGQFYMSQLVEQHLIAYYQSTVGWGEGTKQAMQRLHSGGYTYFNSGSDSTGNGVIMKLCPLAMYYTVYFDVLYKKPEFRFESPEEFESRRKETIIRDVTILCKMTHNTPVCIMTSCLFVLMCERLYREPTLLDTKSSRELFLQYVMELAMELEFRFIAEQDTSKFTNEKALATISFKLKEIWDNLDTITNEKLIEVSSIE